MDFKALSKLSRIDYHLNEMTKELWEFSHDAKNNLTADEFNILSKTIDKLNEALNNITENITY